MRKKLPPLRKQAGRTKRPYLSASTRNRQRALPATTMPRKQFDLIVFDWDGTLMDSTPTIVACIQAAARDLGLPVPESALIAAECERALTGLGAGSVKLV